VSARVQRFARRWWAGGSGSVGFLLTVLLTPVSWLWAVVGGLRNGRYDRQGGVAIEGVRVISVGNLAVGGTGKTPVASWMVRVLSGQGARPAVLLGGYGRDEALLHEQWTPEATVIVDRDRVSGARRAYEAGAEVVIMDDGFQHRRLARSLDVVLLSVEDRFPGRMLPTGPYREPPGALARADAVVLTRRIESVEAARKLEALVSRKAPSVSIASIHFVMKRLRSLADDEVTDRLESPLVLTAIARPDYFLADVARLSRGEAELRAYRDHHYFTEDEARRAREHAGPRPIVMTEKDAVKLAPYSSVLGEAWVVEQRIEWDWGERQILELLATTQGTEAP